MHPFDSEAWKHFNIVHPRFLPEIKNMCLELFTDEFNPFELFTAPFSYWSMILMVYNLPTEMCMRPEFMFLSMIILGSNSLGQNIDVCLRPLIHKLK
jgi:hypothetical protein